jgi:hypothetical protein
VVAALSLAAFALATSAGNEVVDAVTIDFGGAGPEADT